MIRSMVLLLLSVISYSLGQSDSNKTSNVKNSYAPYSFMRLAEKGLNDRMKISKPLELDSNYRNDFIKSSKSELDTFRQFYHDTIKVFELEILPGTLTGKLYVFASVGDTIVEVPLVNGLFHGQVKMWYNPVTLPSYLFKRKAQNIKLTAEFVNGVLNGSKKHFYPHGTRRSEYEYLNGQLVTAECWDGYTGGKQRKNDSIYQAEQDERDDRQFLSGMFALIITAYPELRLRIE